MRITNAKVEYAGGLRRLQKPTSLVELERSVRKMFLITPERLEGHSLQFRIWDGEAFCFDACMVGMCAWSLIPHTLTRSCTTCLCLSILQG